MAIIDWVVVVSFISLLAVLAFRSGRHSRNVTDFLAANRCAGRYLIGASRGVAAMGAISVIALWEQYMQAGFTWGFMWVFFVPIGVFLSLSGFIFYRFRQTRALTLAQFFEMRYSKNIRVFSGVVMWISGILNFGIFPGVGARFFMNFTRLPPYEVTLPLGFLGDPTVSLTTLAIMVVLLGLALFFTFIGGQISVIVTDFWQSMFVMFVMTTILFVVLYLFPWEMISEGLKNASPAGQSKFNPFDIGANKDFNYLFYIILFFTNVYGIMAWQGQQGNNVSALNPHEAKMANMVSQLRTGLLTWTMILIPVACLAVMNHPAYSDLAGRITSTLAEFFPGDAALQKEQHTSMFLSLILPRGLIGAFAACMLAFFISTHNTYLHSWGSIFVQDVLLPFRKKPLEPKQHKQWLKRSIFFVAIFIFLFSAIVPKNDYIYMFQQITGAIFIAGAGSLIIGGLYWKRGTTAGAWTAMIMGSVISVTCLTLRSIWPSSDRLLSLAPEFPLNGMEGGFLAALCAIAGYIAVSLLSKKPPDDVLDKLLHRGAYAVEEDQLDRHNKKQRDPWYWRILSVNSKEYNWHDKSIAIWMFFNAFFISFIPQITIIILVVLGLMTDDMWLGWWGFFVRLNIGLGIIFLIITSVGGILDLKKMFRLLEARAHDDADDGVVHHDA